MTKRLLAIAITVAVVASGCSDDDPDASTVATNTPVTAAAETAENGGTEAPAPADAPPSSDGATPTTAPVPDQLGQLRIHHPETLAFAAPFTMLDATGPLAEVAADISVDTWTTPDVLRSLLVNAQTEVTAVPSYVGANLYNRDVDVRMAAVVVWGLTWLLGPDGTPTEWESLRGQTVMIPFPNDMPDLVFQYLATANGLTPGEDFEIEYYAQPPEIVAQLVSGSGTFAVLPEHVATVALAQANQNGQALGRVLDLQAEWADTTGTSPRIPQAGIVVPSAIADNPAALVAVLDALEASVATVNEASPDTIATLSEASGVPAPIVEQVIPRLNLDVVAAADARAELEQFFTELATLSPDIIGGSLPDADFYLPDPR